MIFMLICNKFIIFKRKVFLKVVILMFDMVTIDRYDQWFAAKLDH